VISILQISNGWCQVTFGIRGQPLKKLGSFMRMKRKWFVQAPTP